MKALTLTQPWASLVVLGFKQWETRSWLTTYRGPLAIHAAKSLPVRNFTGLWVNEGPFRRVCYGAGWKTVEDVLALPRGVILGTTFLQDCVSANKLLDLLISAYPFGISPEEEAVGDFSLGRFAWKLGPVTILPEPIPARGALGLWEWTPQPAG